VREIKPIWTTASFLVYLGGLTVLFGGIYALAYLFINFRGGGAQTAWALLILVILLFVAGALRVADRWLAAGIFAFVAVIAWGIFLATAWHWFGWLNNWHSPFAGWSPAHLLLEFLILVVALMLRRIWRFPFIGLISAVAAWFFVTDFISNGGWWTYVVTFFIGLIYLAAGTAIDKPSAFWLHFVGGLLIGVPLLHWFDKSNFDFAVILVVSVIYVLIAYGTRRSSWAVFASYGFFVATLHYVGASPGSVAGGPFGVGGGGECTSTPSGQICHSIGPSGPSLWGLALGLGLLGFWLVFLGLLGRRRRAAVAAPQAPPAEPTPA
jgi:hypothetical protein